MRLLLWAGAFSCSTLLFSCADQPDWRSQTNPHWPESDSGLVWRSVPLAEGLVVLQDCDSCHSISANALAFDHDAKSDSLLSLVLPNRPIADSAEIAPRLGALDSNLWTALAPQGGWSTFFAALPQREQITWDQDLSVQQQWVLAELRARSGARYLQLSPWDSAWVKASGNRKGQVRIKWAWTLWDLEKGRLLLARSYDGSHSARTTGAVDRAWHTPALGFFPVARP